VVCERRSEDVVRKQQVKKKVIGHQIICNPYPCGFGSSASQWSSLQAGAKSVGWYKSFSQCIVRIFIVLQSTRVGNAFASCSHSATISDANNCDTESSLLPPPVMAPHAPDSQRAPESM
jgi:hypothetical protein